MSRKNKTILSEEDIEIDNDFVIKIDVNEHEFIEKDILFITQLYYY